MSPTTLLSRRGRVAALVVLAPAAALLAAFGSPRGVNPTRVVTITAKEFAFVAPDTIQSGVTTVRLLNRGNELHHVELIRLSDGRTMKDFFAAMQAGDPPPVWAHFAGGPNTSVPGGEFSATLDLTPGRYVLACFIPSTDRKPHVMKGMAKEIIVVPAPGARVEQAGTPLPTSTMTLSDYHFALTRPLTTGHNVVHVTNAASQPHEVLLVKLAPGKTASDMATWVDRMQGPPPGTPMGGTTGIESGGWNDLSLDLTPGSYALICFWPDAHDGRPHVAHGMATEFTIR